MATFAWRGRNARGELVQGQLDAAGEGAVVDQLVAMGVAPVHIAVSVEPGESKGDNWLARLGRQSVSVEDILIFSRQMYTLNKAGVPILRAFAGLQASAVKPAMVDLLKDIRSSLDQGRELSVALGRHMDIFGAFYVAMSRVGEMTGRLTEVFLRLNEHMEFERDVRERIKQALRYPAFVMIAMAIAQVMINVFVIPMFAKVFAGLNAELWAAGSRETALELLREALSVIERTHGAELPTSGAAATLATVRELARMELAQGRGVEVLALLERHRQLLPGRADLWALRANAAQRVGQHAEASLAYRTALDIRPGEARWMLGAAVSMAALGQLAAAADMVDKARQVEDGNPEVLAYLRRLGVPMRERQ